MKNKNILITGASSGIGLQTATFLLENNFNVALFARNLSPLEKLKADYPDQVNIYETDLLEASHIDSNVKKALNDMGEIDAFIHSAGIGIFGSIQDTDISLISDSLQINLSAAIHICSLLIPSMIENNQGHFIFLNSIASKDIFPGGTVYGTAKAALKMFADSLREELREHNIAVTSIYPGATKTPWWDGTALKNEKMTASEDVAKTILNILQSPDSAVIEDIILRRIEGNF